MGNRPLLLDLFCGAGGCSMGYHRAGFDVTGVDINPQPRYPFKFIQADAMTFPLDGYDVIHASPPCQHYSVMSKCRPGLNEDYPDLIDAIRQRLQERMYVIENVTGSSLMRGAIRLCGSMFGLELYRHRHFETSHFVFQPQHKKHKIPCSKANHWKPGTIISVCGDVRPMSVARKAMGIDWMKRNEIALAIPPSYTEYIGKQLMEILRRDE